MNFAPRIRVAYAVALLTLVMGGLGFRGVMVAVGAYLEKLPVPLRRDLATIPTTLGDWKRVGSDRIESQDAVHELGTDLYLTRTYARDGDPSKGQIGLHLAYYTGMIDAVPHIPERCAYAAGLREVRPPSKLDLDFAFAADTTAPQGMEDSTKYAWTKVKNPVSGIDETVALPSQPLALTLTAFQEPGESRVVRDIGYFFVANGGLTPSSLGVRGLAFNLTDKYAYYCKVQLSMNYPMGGTDHTELYRKDAQEFLKLLMPHLMRSLPDWPSVEASTKRN